MSDSYPPIMTTADANRYYDVNSSPSLRKASQIGYIYGLIDIRTGLVGYIGQSADPTRRWAEHIDEATRGTGGAKCAWIRDHIRETLRPPPLMYIEAIPGSRFEYVNRREEHYIKSFLKRGHPLTNKTIPNRSRFHAHQP